ncbi:hypothetical protein HK104_004543 [Borealophlyctis nickersoniae]|nr:hypothetical protein HK104_004543 [Borealophlyctis nickersoniae]
MAINANFALVDLQRRITEVARDLENLQYSCSLVSGVPVFFPLYDWTPQIGGAALAHFNSPAHADIVLRVPRRSRSSSQAGGGSGISAGGSNEVDVFLVHSSYLSRSEVFAQMLPGAINVAPPGSYLATLTINPPAPRQFADALHYLYTGSIDPSTLAPNHLIGTLLNALYLRLPLVLAACRPRLHEALPLVASRADFGPRSVPPQLLADLMRASRSAGGPLNARDRLEILLAWGKDVPDEDSHVLRSLTGSLMQGEELDVAEMAVLAERWGSVFERAVPPSIVIKAGLFAHMAATQAAASAQSRPHLQSFGQPSQQVPSLLRKGDSTAMSFVWED